ncbi:MAG: OmpA family protein [Nitrospira sp.]|nr:OmpA family protein [Nitrospira sp.]
MSMQFVALAFLFVFTVNGQESSLAAAHQSAAKHQTTAVRSDNGHSAPSARLVGFGRPADLRYTQQDLAKSSYAYTVDSEEAAPATSIVPMTSITVDTPQSQGSEADRERVRLEQIQQLLSTKENELAILRDKTAAATNQLNVEKTRADALEAQLTQKEQELSGICAQRDTHQQMSQDLNRTKSSLEQANQQVIDIEREFIVANEHLSDATQRLAAKEQELRMTKSNLDKMTHTLADLDRELLERNTQLTQAKQLLANLGRSMPKQGHQSASNKSPVPGPTGSSDLGKVRENLASALQEELKGGTVALRQRGNKLTLALASGEVFALGDATMTPAGTSLLERIGAALQQFRIQRIEVAGHTDSIPVRSDNRRPFRDNLELSQARAQHAGQTLIASGLGADRIKTVGYAATKPIASNKTAEGRSKNRRVEIIVTPWSGPATAPGKGKKVEQVANKPAQQKKAVQKIVNR